MAELWRASIHGPLAKKQKPTTKRINWVGENLQTLLDLRKQGKGSKEIAEFFGTTAQAVSVKLYKLREKGIDVKA